MEETLMQPLCNQQVNGSISSAVIMSVATFATLFSGQSCHFSGQQVTGSIPVNPSAPPMQ